ncbi:MAG TPA: hypothetical protein VKV25_05590 [Acidimicrobiales bacterium]|nr:hypothetical protein [Acidimicrobiales bacterium]
MPEVLFLRDDEVRELLELDDLAAALTAALIRVSAAEVSVPPRVGARSPHGLLGAMPGWVAGMGLAAKLVTVHPGNDPAQHPTHQALVAVFDEVTGAPTAVLGATYLTAIRTAMTAAVAARALAPPGDGPVTVLGAGVQGEAHLAALAHLLPGRPVRVWSRRAPAAEALAARTPGASAVGDAREAVREAAVVCCCTGAPKPVLAGGWIAGAAHVSSVGSGPELPAELLARARVVVETRAVTAPPPAGAPELQGWDPGSLTELGEVLAGTRPGRDDPGEVTVFKSTGHAAEDVAAAAVVLRRARQAGAGTALEL